MGKIIVCDSLIKLIDWLNLLICNNNHRWRKKPKLSSTRLCSVKSGVLIHRMTAVKQASQHGTRCQVTEQGTKALMSVSRLHTVLMLEPTTWMHLVLTSLLPISGLKCSLFYDRSQRQCNGKQIISVTLTSFRRVLTHLVLNSVLLYGDTGIESCRRNWLNSSHSSWLGHSFHHLVCCRFLKFLSLWLNFNNAS